MEFKILSRKEIEAVEEETEKRFGISRLILMENAGRSLAECLIERLGVAGSRGVAVISGKGNNGGDGFVAARYLFNAGIPVEVFYSGIPEKFTGISFTNYQILLKMNIKAVSLEKSGWEMPDMGNYDAVIDAIFGSGIRGAIEGRDFELIEHLNRAGRFVLCADAPSGLNPDTGEIAGIAVKGNMTLGLGFARRGFYTGKGPEYCGEIRIADIGFPRFYYIGGTI